jgi:alpha-L-fucosidase 2
MNISWQKGRLQKVEIVSNAGNDCLLRYDDKELKLSTKKGLTYSFDGELKAIK